MRSIAPLVLAVAASSAVTLSTDYDAKRVLVIEAASSLEMRTTEFEITRDGEPLGVVVDDSTLHERRVVVRERLVESAEGVPMRVEREFREVEGRTKRSIVGSDIEGELECPLDGVTLRLRRAGDEVEAEVAKGKAPDAPLLEGHRLELATDACLPDHEVEEEGTWELESAAICRLLGLDVARVLFPPRKESVEPGWHPDRDDRSDMGTLAAAKWTGTATLVSTSEEHAGERCARIDLALTSSAELPDGDSFEADLRGHLLFSLDTRRPVRLELEGDVEFVTDTASESDGRQTELHKRREGEFAYRVQFSVDEDS